MSSQNNNSNSTGNILTNSQEYKHQNKERLCYYTNTLYDKEDIIQYTLSDRGYGSIFDGDEFQIQIQKDVAKELECKNILRAEWFDNQAMRVINGELYEEYTHEEDIENFINILIVENQEYIRNCDNWMMSSIDREDWIKTEKKFNKKPNNCICYEEFMSKEEAYTYGHTEGIYYDEKNSIFYYVSGSESGERNFVSINNCPKCGRELTSDNIGY